MSHRLSTVPQKNIFRYHSKGKGWNRIAAKNDNAGNQIKDLVMAQCFENTQRDTNDIG